MAPQEAVIASQCWWLFVFSQTFSLWFLKEKRWISMSVFFSCRRSVWKCSLFAVDAEVKIGLLTLVCRLSAVWPRGERWASADTNSLSLHFRASVCPMWHSVLFTQLNTSLICRLLMCWIPFEVQYWSFFFYCIFNYISNELLYS